MAKVLCVCNKGNIRSKKAKDELRKREVDADSSGIDQVTEGLLRQYNLVLAMTMGLRNEVLWRGMNIGGLDKIAYTYIGYATGADGDIEDPRNKERGGIVGYLAFHLFRRNDRIRKCIYWVWSYVSSYDFDAVDALRKKAEDEVQKYTVQVIQRMEREGLIQGEKHKPGMQPIK